MPTPCLLVLLVAWLRRETIRRLDHHLSELDEYIRKHDYRFRHEGLEAEREAPLRAVERAVGRPLEGGSRVLGEKMPPNGSS